MQVLAVVLEPPLFALADRWPRRPMIAAGLLVLGCSCLLAAVAQSYFALMVALAIYGPAAGIGVALSQATLVDANPTNRERTLARWEFLSAAGDLSTPLLLAAVVALGLSWRAAFAICAVVIFADALAVWRGPDVEVTAEEEPEDEEPRGLRAAVTNRELLKWTVACLFCALLDEILVAFGSLSVDQSLHAGPNSPGDHLFIVDGGHHGRRSDRRAIAGANDAAAAAHAVLFRLCSCIGGVDHRDVGADQRAEPGHRRPVRRVDAADRQGANLRSDAAQLGRRERCRRADAADRIHLSDSARARGQPVRAHHGALVSHASAAGAAAVRNRVVEEEREAITVTLVLINAHGPSTSPDGYAQDDWYGGASSIPLHTERRSDEVRPKSNVRSPRWWC